mgnify:CR=1 FL=1
MSQTNTETESQKPTSHIVGWITLPNSEKHRKSVLKVKVRDPKNPKYMIDVGYVLKYQLKALIEDRSQGCPIQVSKKVGWK